MDRVIARIVIGKFNDLGSGGVLGVACRSLGQEPVEVVVFIIIGDAGPVVVDFKL